MKEPAIIASVLGADYARLGHEVAELEAAGVDRIQWDIMDGRFVPNLTFGADVVGACRSDGTVPFEAHLMVVVASSATEARAAAAGFEIASLDGTVTPDVAVDGADELDRELNLIKGHGAALLREKLVVAAANRFFVLAERAKLVGRLGEGMLLPVEVVRFAWAQTRRRLLEVVPEATLGVVEHGPFPRHGRSGLPGNSGGPCRDAV
jgi:hypothetical protein